MLSVFVSVDSIVGIATGYRLDNQGVGVRVRTLSPGVKLQGREADHSPPTSAEVKKMLLCTSIPPYSFMV
jgi:hypothetical protein